MLRWLIVGILTNMFLLTAPVHEFGHVLAGLASGHLSYITSWNSAWTEHVTFEFFIFGNIFECYVWAALAIIGAASGSRFRWFWYGQIIGVLMLSALTSSDYAKAAALAGITPQSVWWIALGPILLAAGVALAWELYIVARKKEGQWEFIPLHRRLQKAGQ